MTCMEGEKADNIKTMAVNDDDVDDDEKFHSYCNLDAEKQKDREIQIEKDGGTDTVTQQSGSVKEKGKTYVQQKLSSLSLLLPDSQRYILFFRDSVCWVRK